IDDGSGGAGFAFASVTALHIKRVMNAILLPPRLAGGINGSISAHSSSVRSLGYRNALRSYRPRFFDVHIGDPPRIRPPLLNHKRLTGFNMFSDRHYAFEQHRGPRPDVRARKE